jgi:hypothetical protein
MDDSGSVSTVAQFMTGQWDKDEQCWRSFWLAQW